MRLVGHVTRKGEMRNAYNILVGKWEEKRPCGGPIGKWENNIRMVLRETG
jgi:hypothetical protein